MANRKIETRPIDVELIKQRMKEQKISIRKLSKYVDRDEATIRRYFEVGAMPISIRQMVFEALNIVAGNRYDLFEGTVFGIENDLKGLDLTESQRCEIMDVIKANILF
jgi:hypothetical protein